jgi:simple sugar transport system permease protein
VGAVHGAANASLIAGYGYSGILIAFAARFSPAGVVPVAILVGGIAASGSLLQRRLGLPDASVTVLLGFAFVALIGCESLRGLRRGQVLPFASPQGQIDQTPGTRGKRQDLTPSPSSGDAHA